MKLSIMLECLGAYVAQQMLNARQDFSTAFEVVARQLHEEHVDLMFRHRTTVFAVAYHAIA